MNEQQEQAIQNFNKAGNDLRNASNNKSRTINHERDYGKAYEQLVRLGLYSKLRNKYRG